MCAATGRIPALTSDGTIKAATVIYTAVVVIPIPRIIAATAVKHNRGNKFPPDKSITDCVNFNPNPDTKTEPIITPAQAHAIVTGTVDLIPASKALKISTTDILVLAFKKLSNITDTILQKPAVIAV